MLVIRLSRTGRNKYPTYRIVAAEQARATTGKFVAILGHYNPHTKELVLQRDEIARYLKNGAQPSNTVIKLLQQQKIELPAWVQLKTRNRAPKKEVAAPEAAPAAEPTEGEAASDDQAAAETEDQAVESVVETAAAQAEAVEENDPSDNEVETAEKVEAETEAAEATTDVPTEEAAGSE